MRYYEISSGLRVPVSAEEQEVIDVILPKHRVLNSELDERQQEIARLMVGRGLLNRKHDGDKTYLILNSSTDVWRF